MRTVIAVAACALLTGAAFAHHGWGSFQKRRLCESLLLHGAGTSSPEYVKSNASSGASAGDLDDKDQRNSA
jgi:hypothetical protein